MSEPSVWVPFLVLSVVALGLLVWVARLRGQVVELRARMDEFDRRAAPAAGPVEAQGRRSGAAAGAVVPEQPVPATGPGTGPPTGPATEPSVERALSQPPERVRDRLPATGFTDQVLAESVFKGAGLLHGLRRALTPETRNRIAFSMRQEVKRARKQRRTEIKAARRHLADLERAELAGNEDAA